MKEVDHKSTSRALAFELWMKAMVTLMKTLDVTALVRLSRKRSYNSICSCAGVSERRQPVWRTSTCSRWGTS